MTDKSNRFDQNIYPIDAVVTWVDGDDPIHRAKRRSYTTKKKEDTLVDIAGDTRYRSVGEIAYCVASINRFAPWIRKIFIVTDNQNPQVDNFMRYNFPQGCIPMEIVDHKEIFREYEQYLPTFNSISIVNMLWRIQGLSEHFICFNDDLFLLNPVQPSDFFYQGAPIANGYWHWTWTARFLHKLRRRKNGHKSVTFRDSMMRASQALGMKRFIRMVHTPHPLRKSLFAQLYKQYPRLLDDNICYRFRNEKQFSSCALFYCYTIPRRLSVLTKRRHHYLYLSPGHNTIDEVRNILHTFDNNPNALFCCFNSLDMADKEVIDEITAWMNRKIGVKIPPQNKD